jgi:hypothetical protein
MKPFSRAARALLVLAAAAAPARALAQEAEAWVLPRGLLEVGATGIFLHYDERLGYGGQPLGVELLGPLSSAAQTLSAGPVGVVRSGLAGFFAGTTAPQPGTLPDSLTAGTVGLRLAGDVRLAPITVRYGLSRRITLSLTIPFERRGTSAAGPYLAGGTLGLNPNTTQNGARLAAVNPAYAALGGGTLLPLRDSPEGRELQSRLVALEEDTLQLPLAPINLSQLLAVEPLRALLTAEQAAALGLVSARRPYQLGDVQLGARFLLRPGPAGWPYPDSQRGRAFRTVVGARVRLPTGRGGTSFLTEIPSGNGHLGVGVDVLNDVFISRRWMVNAAASLDVLMPADVPRLAFAADRPFPADSAIRTVRREPGPRLAFSLTPRWRLTDEISFSAEYALLAQGRTNYSGAEGVLPSPLEWRTGGSMHALGVGARYSSLQAFARGRAALPFEVTLTVSRAVVGAGLAPDAGMLRLTGRVFTDPRRFRTLLPSDPPDTTAVAAPPAGAAADTLPSQLPPRPPRPVVAPSEPDTLPRDTAAVPPGASARTALLPMRGPASAPEGPAASHRVAFIPPRRAIIR